eukprot:TRINITY_DN14996_c0_g1_i1.p1 TRINITY_DN14996_c0_g1~~TRINITY_DN14996_c0_g1_i1.p1  ORF type:complete len:155 (-),score=50.66 TRINITY_DN14996_c0_g1_i1:32-496(-)
MADMFEQAVAASFDQTPAGAEMRRQAEQWLAQIMASPEHDWRFFLQRFDSSPTPQVKFWCIHALTERLATMGVDERPPFQQALVEWLAGPCIQRPMAEVYLRNKFAALYLSLIHISEPTRLLSISYAVFCLKKKKKKIITTSLTAQMSLAKQET